MIKRNTIQCSLVLNAVNKLKNHATADEVYASIINDYPNISRATVYRNLDKLAKTGQIKKIEVPREAERFDHLIHNHYHIKCLHCGHIFDVDMPYQEHIEDQIKNKHGFLFLSHEIIFTGICPDCLKEAEKTQDNHRQTNDE